MEHRTRGPKEGKKVYKKLVEHDRQNIEGWYMLGLSEAETGNRKKSIKATARALKLSPDHAESLNNQGVMLTQLDRFAEAAEQYKKVVKHFPLHNSAADNLASVLKHLGRTEEAVEAKAIGAKTAQALQQATLGGMRRLPRDIDRG